MRHRTAINLTMTDGMVSIADGKAGGGEASPSNKRRGTNVSVTGTSAAPGTGTRVKRSPQGSVAGESSTTKGSERDEMEEVSNEEGKLTLKHFRALFIMGLSSSK